MAATNFTPIQLYFSTTASAVPLAANLAQGELAINITDGKLYYEDNGGVVQVIATKGAGTIGGSTTQIQYNNAGALAGNAAMVFNNSTNVTTLTTLNLTNALGAIYGGTAQSTYTQGDFLYASATNTLSKLGIGTVNYILTSTGTVPQWSAPSSIIVQTATNLAGGLAGSVPYQSALDTTTFLAIGAANRVMTSTGTAPQWVTSLTGLTGVSSSSITNTSLTSGRVVVSTTAGLQADDADLTFDGTTLSAGGLSTVGLSTLVKTVTIGNSSFNGSAVFAAATPAKLYIGTGTVTDVTSAISATNAIGAIASLAITPIAATNTSVTYTNAATLYIAGAPSAGTNVTLTNPYSLYVAGGDAYFGGTVTAGTVNLTTLDLTNLEVTNIKAKDGTAAMTIADSTGVVSFASSIAVDGTTDSTSTTTGSIQTDGGVGIAKALVVGTTAQFGANPAGVSIGVIGIPNQKRIYGRNAANTADVAVLYVDASNGLVLGPTDSVTINSSGNVGIGISNPATPLDVTKAGGSNFVATFQNTTAATPYCVTIKDAASPTAGYPLLTITDSTGATSYLRVDSLNGNVGIGASPSTAKLDVRANASTSYGAIIYNTNATGQGLTIRAGSTSSQDAFNCQTYDGGLSLFAVQGGGNVGIGTSSPASRLNLSGTSAQTLMVSNISTSLVTDDSMGTLDFAAGTSNTTNARVAGLVIGTSEAGGTLSFETRADGGSLSEKVRITGAGLVGIGTNDPTSLLTVGSGGNTNTLTLPALRVQGYDIPYGSYAGIILHASQGQTVGARRYLITNALSAANFAIIRSTDALTDPALTTGGAVSSGTADFVISNAGLVGIGTTTPALKAQINGVIGGPATSSTTQTGIMRLSQTSGSLVLDFGVRTSPDVSWIQSVDANNLATNYPLLINPNGGNVLVGATNSSSQTGRFEVHSPNASTAGMFKTTAGSTTAWACNFWNDSTGGNNLFVEFATETSYSARGSITYNRAGNLTVYNTTSDARLKQNIVDAPSALSKIASIQIRSFDWKETGNHVDFGVIAQELNQVAPEAVTEGEDNEDSTIKRHWGVDTSVLVPALVKAVQEQQAIIESLKARLDAANL